MTAARGTADFEEQRDFLQSIVDTVRDPMLVLDTSLRIVLASRAFCNTFHLSPDKTQGASLYEIEEGQWDIPALRSLLHEVVSQNRAFEGYEMRHDFPGLGTRLLQLNARKLYRSDAHTEMLLLAIEDVTERTQRETELRVTGEALRMSEERYRTLFETVDKGFCVIEMIFDEQNHPLDYRFLEVNPAFERHTGFVQAAGKRMRDILPTHDAHWFEIYGRVALTGEPIRFENQAEAMGRWFDVYAQRVGEPQERKVALLFNDISERKQTEERLREISARNERIAETLQHSLLLAPAPDAYPGITVDAIYQSAWDDALIGGDFFDVFAVDEQRVALVVGDATGKGLEAATYTAEVKFALRAFLRVGNGGTAEALSRLSEFIARNDALDAGHGNGSGAYVALSLVLLNTQTGEAVCTCAGAEPPLLLRADGTADEVMNGGPLLGLEGVLPYTEEHVLLERGDLLLMTTDGITEARPPRGSAKRSFFGREGLVRATKEAVSPGYLSAPEESKAGGTATLVSPTLAQVGAYVVQQACAWAHDIQQDDICLLLARRV
jgi:PAS domain S-box-containing protein